MSELLRYSTVVKTAPSTEPVTLAEVKNQCRIDVTDTTEDDWLQSNITAGRIHAEDYQNRAYIQTVYEYSIDCLPVGVINLPRPMLISVDSIKLYDIENTETVLDVSDFIVDTSSTPGRLVTSYGYSWPNVSLRSIGGIKIEFTAGYGASASDVPQDAKRAILLYVNHMYENRASEEPEIPKQFYDILRPNRCFHEFQPEG